MEDQRVWSFEESLWGADQQRYEQLVDENCIMVLSRKPWIFGGEAAIEAVSQAPEWEEVSFSDQQVSRPAEGLIVIGYTIEAVKGDMRFIAACTSVYRRRHEDDWTVIQHAEIAKDALNV